jgi:hypothetical protein
MAKQELCRAVNIKLYNTQANNIKNNQQLNKQWFFNQLFVQTNLFVTVVLIVVDVRSPKRGPTKRTHLKLHECISGVCLSKNY